MILHTEKIVLNSIESVTNSIENSRVWSADVIYLYLLDGSDVLGDRILKTSGSEWPAKETCHWSFKHSAKRPEWLQHHHREQWHQTGMCVECGHTHTGHKQLSAKALLLYVNVSHYKTPHSSLTIQMCSGGPHVRHLPAADNNTDSCSLHCTQLILSLRVSFYLFTSITFAFPCSLFL